MGCQSVVILLLFTLIPLCRADVFSDAAAQLPTCGLDCIIEAIPDSACKSILNETCICTNQNLTSVVQQCVLQNCNVTEQLDVARAQAEACQTPVRSRRHDLLSTISVEVLAGLCLLLRLYSRWWTMQHFELDDYVMMFVGVIYVVFLSLGQTAGLMAFGVDTWTVPPASLTEALKLFYIDEAFYLAILMFTKVSILFFYLRIFPSPKFRIATFIVMGWVIVSNIIFIFMQIFQCIPINYNWEGWTGDFGPHRCLDVNTLTYTAAGFSIAQDSVMILLPLPVLISLNTSWRAKVGIIIMFSLGIFVLITSCVRLRFLLLFARSLNPSWDYTDTLVWTGTEVAVSIIVTSLPAIRVLLNRVVPDLLGTIVGPGSRWRRSRSRDGNGTTGSSSRGGRTPFDTKRSGGGSKLQSFGSRHSVGSGIFSVMGRGTGLSRADDDNESQLELGDKRNGDVRVEIGVGEGGIYGDYTHHGLVRQPSSNPALRGGGGSPKPDKANREASTESVMGLGPSPGVGGGPGISAPGIHVVRIMTTTSTTKGLSPPPLSPGSKRQEFSQPR